jgi:hypothetical protein
MAVVLINKKKLLKKWPFEMPLVLYFWFVLLKSAFEKSSNRRALLLAVSAIPVLAGA